MRRLLRGSRWYEEELKRLQAADDANRLVARARRLAEAVCRAATSAARCGCVWLNARVDAHVRRRRRAGVEPLSSAMVTLETTLELEGGHKSHVPRPRRRLQLVRAVGLLPGRVAALSKKHTPRVYAVLSTAVVASSRRVTQMASHRSARSENGSAAPRSIERTRPLSTCLFFPQKMYMAAGTGHGWNLMSTRAPSCALMDPDEPR